LKHLFRLFSIAAAGLVSFSAAASPKPAAMKDGWPVTKRTEIYKVSDLKVGDRGIGYTVFRGGKPEPFEVEILGIMEGMLGPHRDVILAKLIGEKIEFTGVISGMSGSPVYFDGKLLGAVSYRFGTFSKEPIAGITPIDTMFDVERDPQLFAPPANPAGSSLPIRLSTLHAAPGVEPVFSLPRIRPAPTADGLRPIDAPITLSGFPPVEAEALRARLEGAGLFAVVGAGGSKATPKGKLSPNEGTVVSGVVAPPIAAASPIAVVLMRGDLDAAGTGTVTYFEDGLVLAFGHPMFGYGHVSLPMATAAIVNTLSTPLGSYKQAATANVVGSITQDRLSAIGGRLGGVAPMVPVRIKVAPDKPSPSVVQTDVEIVDHELWFPVMMSSALASSAVGRIADEAGGSLDVKATFEVRSRGTNAVRALVIEDTYSSAPPYRPVSFAAQDLAGIAGILMRNGLDSAAIDRIDVELKVRPTVELTWIEEVIADRAVVKPGESVKIRVRLRPYRAQPIWTTLSMAVPADASGEVEVVIGGASELDLRDEAVHGDRVPETLDDLLGLLAERRPSRGLYARLYLKRPGVRSNVETLSSLPPSVRLGLEDATGIRNRAVTEAFGPAVTAPAPGVVIGQQTIKLQVSR